MSIETKLSVQIFRTRVFTPAPEFAAEMCVRHGSYTMAVHEYILRSLIPLTMVSTLVPLISNILLLGSRDLDKMILSR